MTANFFLLNIYKYSQTLMMLHGDYLSRRRNSSRFETFVVDVARTVSHDSAYRLIERFDGRIVKKYNRIEYILLKIEYIERCGKKDEIYDVIIHKIDPHKYPHELLALIEQYDSVAWNSEEYIKRYADLLIKHDKIEQLESVLSRLFESAFDREAVEKNIRFVNKYGKTMGVALTCQSEETANVKALLIACEPLFGDKHVTKWADFFLPYVNDTLVVVGSFGVFVYCKRVLPDFKIFFAHSSSDIDRFCNEHPSIQYAYHISMTEKNYRYAVAARRAVHIHLGHGDSEKSGSAHRMHKIFDEYWAFGQAQVDRFKNAGINMSGVTIRIVGNPFSPQIFQESLEAVSDFIVYAPTWEAVTDSTNISSLVLYKELLNVCTDYAPEIVVKPHPATGTRLDGYRFLMESVKEFSLPGVRYVDRDEEAIQYFRDSVALVCDKSSLITDYLACDNPIFVYTFPNDNNETSSMIPLDSFCYCFDTPKELDALMNEVVRNGNDYLHGERIRAMDYYMDMKKTSNNHFKKLLQDNYTPKNEGQIVMTGGTVKKKILLLLAGGSGTRMGISIPKQFLKVNNKPIISYTLEKFEQHDNTDAIFIVCIDGYQSLMAEYVRQYGYKKVKGIVTGGENRQHSIKNGLDAISRDFSREDLIILHDAVRPDFSYETLDECIATAIEKRNAASVFKCTENMLRSCGIDKPKQIIFRDNTYRILTPQVYTLGDILQLYEYFGPLALNSSTSIDTLLIKSGMDLHIIESDKSNVKITYANDLEFIDFGEISTARNA